MLKTKQKIDLAGLAKTLVMAIRRAFGKGYVTQVKRSGVELSGILTYVRVLIFQFGCWGRSSKRQFAVIKKS